MYFIICHTKCQEFFETFLKVLFVLRSHP